MRKSELTTLERCAYGLFVAVPLITLAYMAVTILYLAVDIPAWDDWRQYQQGKAGAFDLAYLFKPANDTLYPVGKILDSVAVHALAGNAVAYKFLSMTAVLGSLLWLQWKLLRSALNDGFLVACCFASTMFMLCPDTYWDSQYMAFHQAVPLVCLLASLLVIVEGPAKTGWKMALLFGLGLIAGLTYISGAVAIMAAACGLFLLGFRWAQDRRQHLSTAIALGAAGLITSCFQAWVILVAQGGKTHHPDAPWATPLTIDFWMFALGKVARSLQLPRHPVEVSFIIALLSVVAIAATAYLAWRRRDNGQPLEARDKHRVTITLCLVSAVAAYLAIVCAGRALLGREPSGEFFDAFLAAFRRFHFFWVGVLWPWVLAALLAELGRRTTKSTVHWAGATAAFTVFVWMVFSGGLNHRASVEASSLRLQRGVECLQESLLTSETIECRDLYPGEISRGYDYGVVTGASFTRNAPPTFRRHNPSPKFSLFALSDTTVSQLDIRNAEMTVEPGPRLALLAGADPQIILKTGAIERLEKCYMLSVEASIETAAADIAQLFYRPSGVGSFNESNSKRVRLGPDGKADFLVLSPIGFEETLRLDPATLEGALKVASIDVRCLVFLR